MLSFLSNRTHRFLFALAAPLLLPGQFWFASAVPTNTTLEAALVEGGTAYARLRRADPFNPTLSDNCNTGGFGIKNALGTCCIPSFLGAVFECKGLTNNNGLGDPNQAYERFVTIDDCLGVDQGNMVFQNT